jgi:hypothetical protein
MALTFGDRRWHDETTGTVTFPAWSGATRIACRITDEALKSVFGAGVTPTELIETFDRCRASIESAATKKFDPKGDQLKLVLLTSDFETRAPAKPEPKTHSASEIAAMVRRYRASGGAGAGSEPSLLHKGNLAAVMAALAAGTPVPAGEAAGDEAAAESAVAAGAEASPTGTDSPGAG